MADDEAATEDSAAESESGEAGVDDPDPDTDADADVADTEPEGAGEPDAAPAAPAMRHLKLATIAGLVAVLVLAALAGWTGYNAYQSHQAEEQRRLFLQVGRQGAVNLTTIDWQQADADVQRVLDSSTGTFYDDFEGRAQPFLEVVKQAQSKSVGTVTEAGLESVSGDEAQVLVAIKVNTSNAGAPEQDLRAWRMRLTVQKVDGDAKVSNVEFVP